MCIAYLHGVLTIIPLNTIWTATSFQLHWIPIWFLSFRYFYQKQNPLDMTMMTTMIFHNIERHHVAICALIPWCFSSSFICHNVTYLSDIYWSYGLELFGNLKNEKKAEYTRYMGFSMSCGKMSQSFEGFFL